MFSFQQVHGLGFDLGRMPRVPLVFPFVELESYPGFVYPEWSTCHEPGGCGDTRDELGCRDLTLHTSKQSEDVTTFSISVPSVQRSEGEGPRLASVGL